MLERILFLVPVILVAKCLAKRNYSYIIENSQESEFLPYDSKGLLRKTDEVRKFIENYFFVNNKSSRRFKIRNPTLKDRNERKALRTIASRRIVGGKQTSIRMHPYSVALSRHGQHWCGGSLVDEQWVLSAGHCMNPVFDGNKSKLGPFAVRAGSSFYNRGGYQARINKVFFHSSYVPDNPDYDFVLLRLDRPLPIGGNIAVIDLPSREYRLVSDDMLVVTGWGSTRKTGEGDMSSRIQFVLVPVVNSYRCQKAFNFYISPRMLCAGYTVGGKDACNHDSGGPAVHEGVLVGVVSFGGKFCGDPDTPGVYARVSEISDWANHTIHHNEASADPELRERIVLARTKEKDVARTRNVMKNKNEIIRNWLRNVIFSPTFIAKAKKKLSLGG